MRTALALAAALLAGCSSVSGSTLTESDGRRFATEERGRGAGCRVTFEARTGNDADAAIVCEWTVYRDGARIHAGSERGGTAVSGVVTGLPLQTGDVVRLIARFLDARGRETGSLESTLGIP